MPKGKKTKAITDSQAKQIIDLIGEPELALFFVKWLEHGMDATSAYHALHPDVTRGSAQVGGHRMLSRVKPDVLMSVYGIGPEKYYSMFMEGLEAQKRDQYSGEMYPDHQIRKAYHDKLGRILGIEQTGPSTLIQNNGEMTLEFTGGNESQTT